MVRAAQRAVSAGYPQGRVELIPPQGGDLELTIAHARPEQDVPCPLIRPGSVHHLTSHKALDNGLIHKTMLTSLDRRGRPRGTGGGLAYRLWRVVRLGVGQGKGNRGEEEAEH